MHVLLPVPSWYVSGKTFDFTSTNKSFVMDLERLLGKLNKRVYNTCTNMKGFDRKVVLKNVKVENAFYFCCCCCCCCCRRRCRCRRRRRRISEFHNMKKTS